MVATLNVATLLAVIPVKFTVPPIPPAAPPKAAVCSRTAPRVATLLTERASKFRETPALSVVSVLARTTPTLLSSIADMSRTAAPVGPRTSVSTRRTFRTATLLRATPDTSRLPVPEFVAIRSVLRSLTLLRSFWRSGLPKITVPAPAPASVHMRLTRRAATLLRVPAEKSTTPLAGADPTVPAVPTITETLRRARLLRPRASMSMSPPTASVVIARTRSAPTFPAVAPEKSTTLPAAAAPPPAASGPMRPMSATPASALARLLAEL